MADDDGDKKHAPGEKNWADAAEKGQIPKSTDLVSLAVIVGGSFAAVYGAPIIGRAIETLFDAAWNFGPSSKPFDEAAVLELLNQAVGATAVGMMVPLSATVVLALFVNLAQTQGRIASKALEPDFSRVDPIKGFQNHYLSWTPLVELGKGLLKLGLLALASYFAYKGEIELLPALAAAAPGAMLVKQGELATRLVLVAFPMLLIVAVGDFAYSYYQIFQQLKRTDQQVRDENKQQDGDPHFKAHRRAMARKYATQSVLAAVAGADVIITNPTHYSVALRYQRDRDAAPVVLAKGVDHLALIIRTEGMRRGIPRIEDRPLARGLYARVKVGHHVPEDLFMPVARVLAIVYRRRARRKAG